MYKVDYNEVYYLVDRKRGKTEELGSFEEMIACVARKIDTSKYKAYLYGDFDFSGNDFKVKVKIEYFPFKRTKEFVACPYMILDSKGRIIDVRLFDKQIRAILNSPSKYYNDSRIDETFQAGDKFIPYRWHMPQNTVSKFRRGSVFGIHCYKPSKNSYLRRSKLYHNFCLSQNPEAMVRNKAKIEHWDLWDDCYRHTDRSWKTSCKCRHQWEKKLSR